MEDILKRSKKIFECDRILKMIDDFSKCHTNTKGMNLMLCNFIKKSIDNLKQDKQINKRDLYLLKAKIENYLNGYNNEHNIKLKSNKNFLRLKDTKKENFYEFDEILRARILHIPPTPKNVINKYNSNVFQDINYLVDIDNIIKNINCNIDLDDLLILLTKSIHRDYSIKNKVYFRVLLNDLLLSKKQKFKSDEVKNIAHNIKHKYDIDEYVEQISESNLLSIYNYSLEIILNDKNVIKSNEYYYLFELMELLSYANETENLEIMINIKTLETTVNINNLITIDYSKFKNYNLNEEDKNEVDIALDISYNILVHQKKAANMLFEFTENIISYVEEIETFMRSKNVSEKIINRAFVNTNILLGKWISEEIWFTDLLEELDCTNQQNESKKCILYIAGSMALKQLGYIKDDEFSLHDSFAIAICLKYIKTIVDNNSLFFLRIIGEIKELILSNRILNLDSLLIEYDFNSNYVIEESLRDQLLNVYSNIIDSREYIKSAKQQYSYKYQKYDSNYIDYIEEPGDDIFDLDEEFDFIQQLSSWIIDDTKFIRDDTRYLTEEDYVKDNLNTYDIIQIYSLCNLTLYMKLKSINEEKDKHSNMCVLMRKLMLEVPTNKNIYCMELLIKGDFSLEWETKEISRVKDYLTAYKSNDYVNNLLSLTQIDFKSLEIVSVLNNLENKKFTKYNSMLIFDSINNISNGYQYIFPFTPKTNTTGMLVYFENYSAIDDFKVVNIKQLENGFNNEVVNLKLFLERACYISSYYTDELIFHEHPKIIDKEFIKSNFVKSLLDCLNMQCDDYSTIINLSKIIEDHQKHHVNLILKHVISELKIIGGFENEILSLENNLN